MLESNSTLIRNRGKLSPLLGSRFVVESFHNPIRFSERIYRRFGPIAEFDMPALRRHRPRKHLFVIGPDHNREVFRNTDSIRPSGLWSLDGPPGSALHAIQHHYSFKTYGAIHESIVQVVNRPLRRSRVEGHFGQTKAIVQSEISKWPLRTTIDLYDSVRKLAQRVAFPLLFNETDTSRVSKLGELVFQYNRGNWNLLSYLFPVNIIGTPYHRTWQAAETLRSYIHDWIAESQTRSPEDDIVAAFAHVKDAKGDALQAEKVFGGTVFYTVASYESISSTTTWALLLLSLHPGVMANLLDELAAAPAVPDIDHAGLSSLKLLDAVIKEALRLIPPTAVAQFRVFDQCEISGRALLPCDRIVLCPHMTHRLPAIYDAPMRFRPERWFTISPSQYEYLPFMAGPRRCPGSWFGTDFLKVALAAILSRYRIKLDRNARLDWRFAGTTIPRRRIPVQLVEQDRVVPKPTATGSIFELFEMPTVA
jgi:cytochrome P450